MVYFVCSTCGTCLKKNQVTSHWFKCRKDKHVSCMDCGKDFWGEDYSSHLKCITENEKYGGSNYVAKENKGERKQEEWVMKIKEKVDSSRNMDPQLRELLQRVIQYSNIPRKEGKFRNFMKCSCKVFNKQLVDRVWEIFKEAITKNVDGSDLKNGPCVTETNNSNKETNSNNDHKEAEKNGSGSVKLNKRERKDLRREKQSKKSKRDKLGEHSNSTQSGTKRKLDNGEEPNLETIEPRKKNKKRKGDDSTVVDEQVIETAEPRKKKKKMKEDTLQEKTPSQGENDTLTTFANHVIERDDSTVDEEQVVETAEPRKKKKKIKEDTLQGKTPSQGENDTLTFANHVIKRDDSAVDEEQVVETAEPRKKKKKMKEDTLQEKTPSQGENDTLTTFANHVMEKNNENPTQSQCPSAFKWTTTIKRVLQDAPEEGLKVSKLQRKVFSLYYAAHGEAVNVKSKQELTVILHKKLKKNFILHKDKVKLQK